MRVIISLIILILICYSIGMTALASYAWNFNKKKYRLLEEENDLMIYWLQKKLDGIDIEEYLKAKSISSVAFYKFTPVCEMLCAELVKYVEIRYCVDENADNIWDGMENIPIIKPEDVKEQKMVDLLIIAVTKEEIRLKKNAISFMEEGRIIWANEMIKEF